MKEIFYKFKYIWSKTNFLEFIKRQAWKAGKFYYIEKIIAEPDVMEKFRNSKTLPDNYGINFDERVVEYPWLLSKINLDSEKILDTGSTLNFEPILASKFLNNKEITIITLNQEENYFKKSNLMYKTGDIRRLPFRNDSFDCIACISTLEHVGMDNILYSKNKNYRQNKPHDFLKAVAELKRVLKGGGKVFITVPFGKYQNFKWFQQFDAEKINKIIEVFTPKECKISYYKYSGGGWKLSCQSECSNSKYSPGISAESVACLELTKKFTVF